MRTSPYLVNLVQAEFGGMAYELKGWPKSFAKSPGRG